MFRRYFLIVFCVFVLSVLTGIVRSYSLTLDIYISFFTFALATFFLVSYNRHQKKEVFWTIITCEIIILILSAWLLDGQFPILGLPNIVSIVIGTIVGYIFSSKHVFLLRIFITVTGLILCSIMFLYHDNWLNYLNFRNFSGKTDESLSKEWTAYNVNNDIVTSSNYLDKITVLDFWNEGCLVCFKKFPQLQKLYNRYKDNPRVIIQAVNIPWEESKKDYDAFKILGTKGYTFPVIVGNLGMDTAFSVFVYPTVIVMNDTKIIYRGDIEGVENVLINELNKQ